MSSITRIGQWLWLWLSSVFYLSPTWLFFLSLSIYLISIYFYVSISITLYLYFHLSIYHQHCLVSSATYQTVNRAEGCFTGCTIISRIAHLNYFYSFTATLTGQCEARRLSLKSCPIFIKGSPKIATEVFAIKSMVLSPKTTDFVQIQFGRFVLLT